MSGIVGCSIVGRAWAIAFARAGHRCRLFDATDGVAAARERIIPLVEDLVEAGLVDAAAPILGRIEPVRTLEVAVGDAVWVQESAPNDRRGRAGEDCIGRARRVEQRPELPLDFEGRHAVAF